MHTADSDSNRRAAALLRSAANDLKRDDRSAEQDLGLEAGSFAEYASGRRRIGWDLISRAATVWPLNERDLLPVRADCARGLRIVRAGESLASARVLTRGGDAYYEYRDTAMSRVASYRPEWIRMLRTVADDDPDNPQVQWNRGHLLYQFTYFVGPVNYYYRWDGRSYCVPMQTGDSVWGLPFAPHSFTARTDAEPAYILALTYGGDLVGDPQAELAVLGPQVAGELALRIGAPAGGTGLLRSFLTARAATVAEVADRAGLPADRAAALFDGSAQPVPDELAAIADALGVAVRDLLPPRTSTRRGVNVAPRASARRWGYPSGNPPAYRITGLAGDPLHPHTTALEVEVLAAEVSAESMLTTYQHQYLYVLGDAPARIVWRHDGDQLDELLRPGDSVYLQPQVPAGFATAGGGTAQLLLLRIGGAVTTDVRFALGTMAPGGIARYVAEDRLWYRTEGSSR